jgi:hypothetical protein
MLKQIQGVIRGKTIELDQDPGIAEGQRVDVKVSLSSTARPWGEGILRSAGVAVDVPGFDEAFEQVQRDRELATMRTVDE